MKQNRNEIKLNYLNNSMQFSQKLFDQKLLQTDYNKYYENEKGNDSKNKTLKLNNFNNNLNKSNIEDKKRNKIVVNYNFSKINPNAEQKHIIPDYITKTPAVTKNNKIIENNIINNRNKKNLNNSINGKIIPYSSHSKEMKDFKNKIKNIKKSGTNEKMATKYIKNNRINRNLNYTLTDFLSLGGTEIKKNDNANINLNKSPEIIIKRKYINTAKNKLNKKIFGKMNINNINYNLNDNNSHIINNKSHLSNKITNNNNLIQSAAKRKTNKKINISSSSNDNSFVKNNKKYSKNKQFDILKNNLNDEINDINCIYNKIANISDKDNIKRNELIFDTIQNSFFRFIALLYSPKEKEIAFNIIQKLNDFFKKQDNIINNILKKNEDLNGKIKKYKEINKNIEKENLLLKDKCDYLNKKIEDMENEYINNNNLIKNISHNENYNNNLTENVLNESNVVENDEEDESSVNTEELESIRFFDKIIMKKHSFSKNHIPELEIKNIKLKDEEMVNKENINIKKFKNNKNFQKRKNFNFNKTKENQKLKKIGNKSTKTFGYTKIAEDKKKTNVKKFRK